ncbi:MAG: hypothetical protein KC561_20950, partial [Myxococcales bacterium]|nr:hypothetical protein [Myxococcales bacterium]
MAEPELHDNSPRILPGRPLPYGASLTAQGVNFALASRHATAAFLALYQPGAESPFFSAEFPPENRVGHVFCMTVSGIGQEPLEYTVRVDGPWQPEKGHRFDPEVELV